MECLDSRRRAATLAELERRQFDIVVIGGGITGAAAAREAAARGLSVALVEAEDYAAGTSSRSSKLIHGGLRYLALGDVALVRETATERKVVRRIAPHLAQRRWMVLPVRSRAGLLKFRTAITTYEKLGGVEAEDVHRNWDSDDLAREEPVLDRDAFPYACAYREYLTDDARLVIANLRAAAALGAVCLNYLRVRSIFGDGAAAEGVVAECGLSGESVRIRGRAIVNAAGPWVEAVRRLEDAAAPSVLALSKGVHLCFPRDRLPVRHLLLLTAGDRRTLFAIPRGSVTYVGTTDTHYTGAARVWPGVTREDVEYVLEPLSRYCPSAAVGDADVVAAWAGLRPLLAEAGKGVQELSRRDEITRGPMNMVTVAGGKLTGFRPMAKRIVDVAAEGLGTGSAAASLEDQPLPGGDFSGGSAGRADQLAAAQRLSTSAAERLVALYGSDAEQVLELGRAAVVTGSPVLAGEVDWAVTREGATCIEDVLYRRTRAALFEPAQRDALVGALGERMRELLGWSSGVRQREEARASDRLRRELLFADEEER